VTPKLISYLFAGLLTGPLVAQAATVTTTQIVRTAEVSQPGAVTLTRDLYRTESYQDSYTVSVPYQDTETYYESVPYTDTETYTDYESYNDSEYRCRTETEMVESCHDRRDCRPKLERRCDANGKCETTQIGENCNTFRECRRDPRSVQKCSYESVRKTRPVTKTRSVTRYRDERRTRTVTRYRDESRCCVTRERQVFDRQYAATVEVRFPSETALIGLETEKFKLEMTDYDASAQVTITPVSTVYKYEAQVVKDGANNFIITMKFVPTYQPADLGETTLDKFQINAIGSALQLNFVDMGTVAKVQTSYDLSLLDAATGNEIARTTYDPRGQAQVRIDIPTTVAANTDVRLRLTVNRTGMVISSPVNFTVDKALKVQAEAKYDATSYMDKNQVGKFSLVGSGKKLVLNMRDLTKDIPQVKTQYTFKISLLEKGVPRLLAEKTFLREHITVDGEGRIALSAVESFGITEQDLALLTSGKTILIDGQVLRQGTRFPQGSFAIPKKVTLEIE
jgi:hypothetical protein